MSFYCLDISFVLLLLEMFWYIYKYDYDWCLVDIRNNNSGINPELDLCRYI